MTQGIVIILKINKGLAMITFSITMREDSKTILTYTEKKELKKVIY